MKTYLFIGGTADGSRIETNGEQVIEIPVAPDTRMILQGATQKFGCLLTTEKYILQMSLSGEDEDIYLFDKLRSRDIPKLLIAGYSRQP